jgi:hypothetical protein
MYQRSDKTPTPPFVSRSSRQSGSGNLGGVARHDSAGRLGQAPTPPFVSCSRLWSGSGSSLGGVARHDSAGRLRQAPSPEIIRRRPRACSLSQGRCCVSSRHNSARSLGQTPSPKVVRGRVNGVGGYSDRARVSVACCLSESPAPPPSLGSSINVGLVYRKCLSW